ncbi:putative ATP-dependent DNA helicase II subunit 2 [Myriangium duriaei CBS 260.36]|uniref:ATP-dependent DNA helicase II subunit 2 n=1 Tax=Myriangium duriaei CBS 260.36 TaxID=1168546 RepID=A0A9P4JD03_9PEZI|nr:putative ATP-dependent DNA helicase II subunit 2 [Myriangium duriaei CBS 260.36]
MSKEATIYIVDVGASMSQKNNGRDVTDLDWALKYVWERITSTVATDRKTAHIGVIGLKTDDTDNDMEEEAYQNISIFHRPKQMLMPDIRTLQDQLRPSSTDSGDVMSALILAVQMIDTHCRKLQYIRRIILITNAVTPMDASDAEDIAAKIRADNMELVILGVDFDDPDYGFKEEDKSDVKLENEVALKTLAEDCGGAFGTLAQAVDELEVPRVKSVKPIPSYKGYLTLGDPENYDSAMAIDVERYPKVMVAKAPSASSFVIRNDMAPEESQAAEEEPHQGDMAAVKRGRTYQVPDESAPGGKKEVDGDDLAKGYAYGSTAVYISESDRNVTTFETKPGLDIIGFVAKEQYAPYMDMSRANLIVAQRTNNKAALALSSFIHALYELNSYAVARFVPKPDKAPVILLLSPSISPDLECLYDIELPFAEDMRQYRFPPLDRILTVSGKTITQHRNLPSSDLQDAMSAYVDAMDLFTANPEGEEYASIEETFSPMLHRVNQVIRHRAVHGEGPIPPIPSSLTRFSHPPESLTSAAQSQISTLISAADIKRVPPKTLSRRGRSQKEAPKPLSGLDVGALLASSPHSKDLPSRPKGIDPRNAVPEFKQRLETAEDIPAVHAAVAQMGQVVRETVTGSTGDAQYAKAVEYIRVMREQMVELEEAKPWNEFITEFKAALFKGELGGDRGELWFDLRTEKLGLITDKECQEGAGEEDAKVFLSARR